MIFFLHVLGWNESYLKKIAFPSALEMHDAKKLIRVSKSIDSEQSPSNEFPHPQPSPEPLEH